MLIPCQVLPRGLAHHVAVLATVALCAACGNSDDTANDISSSGGSANGGSFSQAGSTANGEPSGGRIQCTLFYRASNEVMEEQSPEAPGFQFEERMLEIGPNEDDSVTIAQLTLKASYYDDAFEGGSVNVQAMAGDTRLFSALYQLRDRQLPDNQFVGDHGFTGLMYLTHPTEGGDYQLICKSV